MIEIVSEVCPVLCLLLFYFCSYLFIKWLNYANGVFCLWKRRWLFMLSLVSMRLFISGLKFGLWTLRLPRGMCFSSVLCCDGRGLSGVSSIGHTWFPGDAHLSDSYRYDRCYFSNLGLKYVVRGSMLKLVLHYQMQLLDLYSTVYIIHKRKSNSEIVIPKHIFLIRKWTQFYIR